MTAGSITQLRTDVDAARRGVKHSRDCIPENRRRTRLSLITKVRPGRGPRILTMTDSKPCLRQQELISEVQKHLSKLAELMHSEAELIDDKVGTAWLDVDRLIEHELGEKERSIGALKEHRREHGC